jgi:hypothetical protein
VFLWSDEPVHGSLKAVVFDILSKELYLDPAGVMSALDGVTIPDIFRHVSVEEFQRVRNIAEPYVQNCNLETAFELLKRAGVPQAQIESLAFGAEANWDRTVEYINTYFGGVETRMQAMLKQSLEFLPDFWATVGAESPSM